MESKPKTIMLIPPTELPIPAVGGGAIETLITHLLEINEKEKKVKLIVVSKYDPLAENKKFSHSKIFYFKGGYYIGKNHRTIRIMWWMYRIWYKLFQNHIILKIISIEYPYMSLFRFQCLQIAKHEHVNGVVYEGLWDESLWCQLNKLVSPNYVYTHIHCERKENLAVRKQVHNSISISQFVRDRWAKTGGIQGDNVVLYNGIDIDRFQLEFSVEQKKNIRNQLGIEQDKFLVIFCGRLIKEKGIKELLDCFDRLIDYPISLLLIGSFGFSASTTTDFSESMLERASKMGNVSVLGYIPNEKMPIYYAISDLQIIPSVWQEGAGLVAIEGMAAGLPIIATKSGGMTEYLSDEAAIQLPIDENLSKNMANAVLELYQDPIKRLKMSKAGRHRASKFSKERYYDAYIKLFE